MHRFMIAALAATCLVFGWIVGGGYEVEAQAPAPRVPETNLGRFQIVSDGANIGIWLVDTVNGETWKYDCPPESRGEKNFGITTCTEDSKWLYVPTL